MTSLFRCQSVYTAIWQVGAYVTKTNYFYPFTRRKIKCPRVYNLVAHWPILAVSLDLFTVFLHCPDDRHLPWRHQMETFPRYWPFVRGIHRPPVDFPHKGQWAGALVFSLICARTNGWANNRDVGDMRLCNSLLYPVLVLDENKKVREILDLYHEMPYQNIQRISSWDGGDGVWSYQYKNKKLLRQDNW